MAEQIESGSDTEESNTPKRTPPHSVTPAAPQGGESDDGLSEGDLDEVLEDLSPVAVKYKRIGLRLGVKCNEIEKIEKQYAKDPDECLYEVLRFRLKQIPALTRPDICNALMSQSVNEQRLARNLQKRYGLRQPLQCELLKKSDIAMDRSKKEHCKKMDPENVGEKDRPKKERLEKESVSAKNREMIGDIAKRHKVAGQSEIQVGSSFTSFSSDDESGVTVGHEIATQKKGKGKAPLHDTELSKRALKNSDEKCKGEKTTPKMTVQVLPTKSSKMKSKGRAKQGVSGSRKRSRTPQVSQAEQSEFPDTETTSTVKDGEQELLSGDQEYVERVETKKRQKRNRIKRKSDSKEKLVHLKELQTDNQTAAIDSSGVEDLSSDEKAVDEVRQKTREEQCQYRKRGKVADEEEHSKLISKPMNVAPVEGTREREVLHLKKRRKRECPESSSATFLVPPSTQELLSGDQEYEERIKTKKRRKRNRIKRKSDRKEKLVHLKELQSDNQTAAIDSSSVEDLISDEKAVDEVRQNTREEQYRKREKEEKHSKPMNVTHVEDTREREILHSKKRRKRECPENNSATILVPPSAQGEFPASQKGAYLSSSSEDEDGSMDEDTNVKGLKKKSHKHHNSSSVSSTDSTAIASSESSSESNRRKQQLSSRRRVKKTRLSKSEVSKCRNKKGRGTKQIIVPNSSDSDSSTQGQCMLSKDDRKNLRSIFRCHFGKLCIAINEPLELAIHLREKGLISSAMMDKMVSSPYSRQEKTIHLVHALDKRIKSNPNHLFVFIEILLQNVVLQDVGRTLWKKTGKY